MFLIVIYFPLVLAEVSVKKILKRSLRKSIPFPRQKTLFKLKYTYSITVIFYERRLRMTEMCGSKLNYNLVISRSYKDNQTKQIQIGLCVLLLLLVLILLWHFGQFSGHGAPSCLGVETI
jgi:hypothetical protein